MKKKPENVAVTKKKKHSKIKEFLQDNPWGTVCVIGFVAFELWALISTLVSNKK